MFFGLGADGTVGANKNSIKIIGEDPAFHAQGYFVYDSKKSGSRTVSHLRFGPEPIRSTYLIPHAHFIGCHQFEFLEQIDVLGHAAPGAVFLLNSPYGPDEVWEHLPREVQAQILDKRLRFYVIDAYEVARAAGHARPDQHHHADLLLRDLGRAAARAGDRQDQGRDREDLRQEGRRGRRAGTSPRSTRRSRSCTRSRSRRSAADGAAAPAAGARRRAGVRAAT